LLISFVILIVVVLALVGWHRMTILRSRFRAALISSFVSVGVGFPAHRSQNDLLLDWVESSLLLTWGSIRILLANVMKELVLVWYYSLDVVQSHLGELSDRLGLLLSSIIAIFALRHF
jgi:hypothetical protein